MGVGIRIGPHGRTYKGFIEVQTNPNTYVAAFLGDKTYAATSNANGIAVLTVKKKGTYRVRTSDGVETYVTCKKWGKVYAVDLVYVPDFDSVAVGGYSTGSNIVYWSSDSAYISGAHVVVSSATTARAAEYEGAGTTREITSGFNAKSYVHTVSRSQWTTFQYTIRPYYDVNGRRFYGATRTFSRGMSDYSGSKAFSGTQWWTIPEGVRRITVFCVGGGGGGASGISTSHSTHNGGGGAGGYTNTGSFDVVPGRQYLITIGPGGGSGWNDGSVGAETYPGGTGGTTSFGDLISAAGGGGGKNATYAGGAGSGYGGSGGSGGAACAKSSHDGVYSSESWSCSGTGRGGEDGGGGATATGGKGNQPGGSGQGRTTRAFGRASGTLYSGGGGGGASGKGGAGGGGAPATTGSSAGNGGANTGGGGGGGSYRYITGGSGGTGICLVEYS